MDSFEINKIFGAICATALFILVLTIVTDFLYSEPELKEQAYVVELPDTEASIVDEMVEVVEIDVMELLVMASLENGQKVAKKCVGPLRSYFELILLNCRNENTQRLQFCTDSP